MNTFEVRRARRSRGYRQLWREVTGQFVGSDLGSGYAFIYVWLANQFGHFMIGFAGSIAFGWLFGLAFPRLLLPEGTFLSFWPAVVTALLWLLVWIAKELLFDVGGALRDLRHARAQREAFRLGTRPPSRSPRRLPSRDELSEIWLALREYVQPGRAVVARGEAGEEAWCRRDILRDSEIDGWFYLSGVLTAVAMYAGPVLAGELNAPRVAPLLPIVTFGILLWWSMLRSADWLWEKIAFDKAALPFVSRFVLNSRPAAEEARRRALNFALGKHPGHLIIIGPPKSGRTTTAVTLGVEVLLRSEGEIVYTTLCKLLDKVAEEQTLDTLGGREQGLDPADARPVWPPEEAELLIIDDVGAQGARAPLLTPLAFGTELRINRHLRQKCESKRVIWVVGDDPAQADDWRNAVQTAFGAGALVDWIAPGELIPPTERLKPRRAA
jgi:hypothetical protein